MQKGMTRDPSTTQVDGSQVWGMREVNYLIEAVFLYLNYGRGICRKYDGLNKRDIGKFVIKGFNYVPQASWVALVGARFHSLGLLESAMLWRICPLSSSICGSVGEEVRIASRSTMCRWVMSVKRLGVMFGKWWGCGVLQKSSEFAELELTFSITMTAVSTFQ